MERVQFQQEQMLAELKDLVQKGLFTQQEIKQIMKKRTAFETVLVRRVAKKSDFLRYAAYEMGLEQLRKKRIERLKLPPSPPSVSDYALVRRQFHIFERALKKFKADVGLWIQYIQLVKREGARALQGRITARALQLHPNTPALYILAASQELDHLSPSAARTLLQRGIRLNGGSVELWREHIKMELGFIERLRRRWDVLGLGLGSDGGGKGKGKQDRLVVGMNDDEIMEVDASGDGEEARKAIMGGAIVKSVISSAVKAIPKVELFASLHKAITDYPSPSGLRQSLLAHLHDLLRSALPDEPQAIKLFAIRFLTPELKGEALIDGLKHANEELLSLASSHGSEGVSRIYAELVEEWCQAHSDNDLRVYFVTSLRSLIQRTDSSSPSLLATHINLIHVFNLPGVLKTARKYTSKAPTSAQVWLARLAAEKSYASRELADKAWSDARSAVASDNVDDLARVWLWGVQFPDANTELERGKLHEGLLKESMRDSSLQKVHELLLISYVTATHEGRKQNDPASTIKAVQHMARAYLPTARVWAAVFAQHTEGPSGVLGEIFEMWRRKDGLGATVAWVEWLIRNCEGKAAKDVVVGSRSWLGDEEKLELERRWSAIVNEVRRPSG